MGFVHEGIEYISDHLGDWDGEATGVFITELENETIFSYLPYRAYYPAGDFSRAKRERVLLRLAGLPKPKWCTKTVLGVRIKYPCGMTTSTHKIVAKLTHPDNLPQAVINKLNSCVDIAIGTAMATLVGVTIAGAATLGAAIAAALPAAAKAAVASFLACAASIAGWHSLKSLVNFELAYRVE